VKLKKLLLFNKLYYEKLVYFSLICLYY